MKKTTCMAACICISLFAGAQRPILHNVYFTEDSYEMTEDLKSQLDSLYDKAPYGATINLGVVGQIKNHGNKNYSNNISEKRSESVKTYLVSRGLESKNISIIHVPYGKNRLTIGDWKQKKNTIQLYEIVWLKPKNENLILVRPDSMPFKPSQKFVINQHNGFIITGKEGTIVTIPDNAFTMMNGAPVPCNKIIIELIECIELGDAIMQGLTTSSGGKMLYTGGMIFLAAWCDGLPLTVKPGLTIQIKIRARPKMYDMELFLATPGKNGIDWQPTGQIDTLDPTTPIDRESYLGDSVSRMDYYVFELSGLGWINCDHFYSSPNLTNVFVKVDTFYKPEVVLVFKDIHSVMGGYYSNNKMDSVDFQNIPEGTRVTLLAFKRGKKKLFLGMKEITITKNMKETIDVAEVSKEEFESEMKEFK